MKSRVLREGRETDTYSHKLPESIRPPENAALIDQKLVRHHRVRSGGRLWCLSRRHDE